MTDKAAREAWEEYGPVDNEGPVTNVMRNAFLAGYQAAHDAAMAAEPDDDELSGDAFTWLDKRAEYLLVELHGGSSQEQRIDARCGLTSAYRKGREDARVAIALKLQAAQQREAGLQNKVSELALQVMADDAQRLGLYDDLATQPTNKGETT